jgi:2-polyprenyl-3-methyl-5-hydroxy-6-metoxy-1,4-benzoquinol methylase
VLTADRPREVHNWVDAAARRLGIGYINAGYIETHASVGPLVIPGSSPCYNCWRLHRASEEYEELNSGLTAASFGPLNALSSAIVTNEVLRHFLGLPARTLDQWALIDAGTLEATFIPARAHPDCDCGAFQREVSAEAPPRSSSLATLAGVYAREREAGSLNQSVLDPVVVELCLRGGQKVLDLGCGIGTVSRALAGAGRSVTAIDASMEMLEILAARTVETDRARIDIRHGDVLEVCWAGEYDLILANMLLDHLPEPEALLKRCHAALVPDGIFIVTLPHPFKDAGGWELRGEALETGLSGRFIVEDYFATGRASRTRLSEDARSATALVTTYRRTLAQYAAMLARADFVIAEMYEPRPDASTGKLSPRAALAAKMPYFLVLLCRRGPE